MLGIYRQSRGDMKVQYIIQMRKSFNDFGFSAELYAQLLRNSY